MGGFHSTSNVMAAHLYKIPCIGTMAHSYVTCYNNLDKVRDYELNGKNLYELTIKYRK